ncbi:MAG: transglutaminase family protein [Phycisphaerales bacterium]|nr:transglutaminase family protein [Phycisphaerales bacterium]
MTWDPKYVDPNAARLLLDALNRLETDDGLLDGAIAVAMQRRGSAVHRGQVHTELRTLQREVEDRLASRSATAIQAHLHDILFEQRGLRGDVQHYDHPDNADVERVLFTGKGLPILLCLVYVQLAHRLGLEAWGVGMPGHFLAGVRIEGDDQLIDPFDGGRVLTSDDARRIYHRIAGPQASWEASHLTPVDHIVWLSRILNNLRLRARMTGESEQLIAYTEMLALLHPADPDLAAELAGLPLDQP